MTSSFSKFIALVGIGSVLFCAQTCFAMKSLTQSSQSGEIIQYQKNKYLTLENEGLWYRSIYFAGIGKVQFFADEAEKIVQLLKDGSEPPEVKCGFLSLYCQLQFSSTVITIYSKDVQKVLKAFENSLVIDLTQKKPIKMNSAEVSFYPAFIGDRELDSVDQHFLFNTHISEIRIKTLEGEKPLELPPQFHSKLRQYLSWGFKNVCQLRQRTPADCFIFCAYMNDSQILLSEDHSASPAVLLEAALQYSLIRAEDLQTGDTLFMDKPGKKQFHYAFYLGTGLFVSKFGPFGLFFTDLETLLKSFGFGEKDGFELYKVTTIRKTHKSLPYTPDYK